MALHRERAAGTSPEDPGPVGLLRRPPAADRHPLGDGEIQFVWWFAQGATMKPGQHASLRRAWGMCSRHAFGYVAVNAALQHGWLNGPVFLYDDLIEHAVAVMTLGGIVRNLRIARRLRASGPCLMCDIGLDADRQAPAQFTRFVTSCRDLTEIRALADATRRYWEPLLCGACAGTPSPTRCRPHLIDALERGTAGDLRSHRANVGYLARHMIRYARSFRLEHRGTETLEDRAALIGALGWCSGWETILRWVGAEGAGR